MDSGAIAKYIGTLWDDSVIPALCDYIRIPNKSPAFDADWAQHGHMEAAVQLLAGWCQALNLPGSTTEIVRLAGRTPLLLCDIPASRGGSGSVLIYGHYDKQPEFTGWAQGLDPWTPVIRDGRLYGRGGADDGYALFGGLSAIAALQAQGIPHGRCLLLIEGCEESGSFDLPHYIEHLALRIDRPDLVICLDAECGNYDQLWLTTSLRGMLAGVLDVHVLTEGVHSGAASGIVPSSFRILRQLLDRIEEPVAGRVIDAFHADIPQRFVEQSAGVAEILGDGVVSRFPWSSDTQPVDGDAVDLILNNTWRPTLSITGFDGAPAVHVAGNTLRPNTRAKLSLRLPPTLDAGTAADVLTSTLLSSPPNRADVRFDVTASETGWAAPKTAPWLEQSLHKASEQFFGRPMQEMGTGGSIPFMRMLAEQFPDVQYMVTGVLGPHSNAHGPNEFLDIKTGKRISCCVAQVLADHAVATPSG